MSQSDKGVKMANELDSLDFHVVQCMECGSFDEVFNPDDPHICADCEDATYLCPFCEQVQSNCACEYYCQHCSNFEEECSCDYCHECGQNEYECACEQIQYEITDIYPINESESK